MRFRWQRNECNHFGLTRGQLLFFGDNVHFFGRGKSVLKRGVLPDSPEPFGCEQAADIEHDRQRVINENAGCKLSVYPASRPVRPMKIRH